MNEWGDIESCLPEGIKWITLEQNGVLQSIQNNNPHITCVMIKDVHDDWGLVGESLGGSSYLEHLKINISLQPDDVGYIDEESFSKGMVMNRSLKSLHVYMRSSTSIHKLFGCLLPLFQNNANLQSISLAYKVKSPAARNNVRAAIEACPSLKSFKLNTLGTYADGDEIIQTICRKQGLHHLTIRDCKLSSFACHAIKEMLSREDCELESLAFEAEWLSSYFHKNDINIITSGLANNSTLKRFRLHNLHPELVSIYSESFQNVSLDHLETIDLEGAEGTNDNDSRLALLALVSAVEKMPALKSFSICNLSVDNGGKKLFDVLSSSTQLLELRVSSMREDQTLQELASYFAMNNSLNTLNLSLSVWDRRSDISSDGWCMFFNSIHTMKLEELDISKGIVSNDSIIAALSLYLSSNQNLRVLKMSGCVNITSGGWRAFAPALGSHIGLEKVNIVTGGDDVYGDSFGLLMNAFSMNSSLKQLDLTINNIAQFSSLSNALESPNCLLKELHVEYSPFTLLPIDEDWRREHTRLRDHVTSLLQSSTSLVALQIIPHDEFPDQLKFDWASISNLICNKSSINATYHSNHTISYIYYSSIDGGIDGSWDDDLPIEVHTLLVSNQNPNKHAVAREKIVQNHTFEYVNFIPSSLPNALSWIGNSGSNMKLNQVYGILRKVPHLFERGERKKRKLHQVA